MAGHRLTAETLETEEALEALLGEPLPQVRAKISDRLNEQTRRFVELAPFVCLATSDEHGNCDVSPRGDPAGFVKILDDRTLLMPERPGNRLADSLRNILRNRHVGLLFLIPGVGDSFRVNGRATLITDQALLASCAVEGKVPRLGILIDVDSVHAVLEGGAALTPVGRVDVPRQQGAAERRADLARAARRGLRRRELRRGAGGALREARGVLLTRRCVRPQGALHPAQDTGSTRQHAGQARAAISRAQRRRDSPW